MSQNSDFITRLKGDLISQKASKENKLALLAKNGMILYSELPSEVESKLMLFKPSFPGLTVGSNITLLASSGSLIAMCASEKTLIAVQTKQPTGFTLVTLSTIIKRYATEFDKYAETAIMTTPKLEPEEVTEELIIAEKALKKVESEFT